MKLLLILLAITVIDTAGVPGPVPETDAHKAYIESVEARLESEMDPRLNPGDCGEIEPPPMPGENREPKQDPENQEK